MSARIVVGYTATDAGRDAVAVGSRLAAASRGALDLVLVLPADDRSVITPPDSGYDRLLLEQAETWLAEGAAAVPDAVSHALHVRFAESFAEGLVTAARELGASHIVIGAANGSLRGRYRLGTVATELLYSSDVPVVLAPSGSAEVEPAVGVTRITVAVGTRPGAEVLVDEAVELAAATGAPLRLLSLVSVDLPASVNTGALRTAGAAHAETVLAGVRDRLPDDLVAEAITAPGDSIEQAVATLEWQPGELVVVGSSRLAQPRRLFFGSTAAKMLHELPVPMIVVPRTRTAQEGA